MSEIKVTTGSLSKELERLNYRKRFWSIVRNSLYMLMAVAAVAVLIAVLWLPVLRVYGHSMDKTLQEGDVVLTVKGAQFETGDVISFYYNNKILIKRVIANPGDWVDITSDGDVYVNQKKLDEPYLSDRALGQTDLAYPYQVPEGQLFVLGDNRETSIDSRHTSIGGVSEEQIVGKIVYRVWPIKNIGTIK